MSRTSFEMMNDGEGRKLISSMDVDVYDHFDEDESDAPAISPSIYSAAIIATLGTGKRGFGTAKGMGIYLTSWILVAFNVVASAIIIQNVKEIRDETPVCEADFELLILATIIFNTYNVGEMLETFDIAVWIHSFETVQDYQQLALSKEDMHVVSGLTTPFKWCVYLLICLPKLILGVLLAYYGTGYLLVSDSNNDIILNCTALTFITQIDELIYDAMVPASVKCCIDEIPPFEYSPRMKLFGFYRPLIVIIGITTITTLSYSNSC